MDIKTVMEAVNKYFSDTSRTKEETLSGLQEILDEIDMMMDSLN